MLEVGRWDLNLILKYERPLCRKKIGEDAVKRHRIN